MDLEPGLEIGYDGEEIRQGSDNGIKVKVNMVGSNIHRQLLRSISCFFAGVLCAHVAGVEQVAVGVS